MTSFSSLRPGGVAVLGADADRSTLDLTRQASLFGVVSQRRADAMQNRDKLLEAADTVFLELGVNAPLDAVAERAGVGRATLFRNFADRTALLSGLFERSVDALEREAMRFNGDGAALIHVLRFVADFIALRAPIVEYWRSIKRDTPEGRAGHERVMQIFEKVVDWAVADGACRPDLVATDLFLLVSMLNGILYARDTDEQHALAERALALIVETIDLRDTGLRARAAVA